MEIIGIDTIQGLAGSPPKVIEISQDTVKAADKLRQMWNAKFLAFLPYCFSCKEPLVWHNPLEEDGTLFHCPKCLRRWVVEK